MMYVATPSGWSLRRTASASMPMPMRSSERNKSRACCLVKVMVFSKPILAEVRRLLQMKAESGCATTLSGRLLMLVTNVLDQRNNPAHDRQSNQYGQCWFLVAREKTENVPAIK